MPLIITHVFFKIKEENDKIKHITCTNHLLHNTMMEIFKKRQDIKLLVTSFHTLIGFNYRIELAMRQFTGFLLPVETRWGTFLNFLLFLYNNRDEIKNVLTVNSTNTSIAYKNVCRLFFDDDIIADIKYIIDNYGCLVKHLKQMEGKKFSISEGVEILKK